jgi:hypothetical protein
VGPDEGESSGLTAGTANYQVLHHRVARRLCLVGIIRVTVRDDVRNSRQVDAEPARGPAGAVALLRGRDVAVLGADLCQVSAEPCRSTIS